MKLYLVINTVGLVLDMAGVALIFFYGISSMLDLGGHFMIVTKTPHADELKKEIRFKRLSKLGIILIFIGFLFQIISNFLK